MSVGVAPARPRIGLDIGGTKLEAISLDPTGAVTGSLRLPTEPGEAAVLRSSELAVRTLAERAGVPLDGFASVGIGIPGRVDRSSGVVHDAVNLGVRSLALGPDLSARIGLPVTLDNDVTAAAVGAVSLLGLRGTAAYLNLGTGLAAGVVVDGVPWRGGTGIAGEIGHLPFDSAGLPCACGQRGCLETAASGSALKRTWPAGGEHPGRVLLAAIAAGDPDAQRAFDRLVSGAAHCVQLLALSVDPSAIVIGGGLRLLGDPLIEGIRNELDARAATSPFLAGAALSERVRLLDGDSPAAAVGAALSADR